DLQMIANMSYLPRWLGPGRARSMLCLYSSLWERDWQGQRSGTGGQGPGLGVRGLRIRLPCLPEEPADSDRREIGRAPRATPRPLGGASPGFGGGWRVSPRRPSVFGYPPFLCRGPAGKGSPPFSETFPGKGAGPKPPRAPTRSPPTGGKPPRTAAIAVSNSS